MLAAAQDEVEDVRALGIEVDGPELPSVGPLDDEPWRQPRGVLFTGGFQRGPDRAAAHPNLATIHPDRGPDVDGGASGDGDTEPVRRAALRWIGVDLPGPAVQLDAGGRGDDHLRDRVSLDVRLQKQPV